jgi:hypothetical protein
VHNEYLRILAELGVIGVALLAGLVVMVGRTASRLVRASGDASNRWVAIAIVTALAGAAVAAGAGFLLDHPLPVLLIAVFLGVLVALSRGSGPGIALAPAVRRVLLALLALAWLANAYASAVQIRSSRHVHRMAQAARQEDWLAVIQQGREAHEANPCQVKALFLVGSACLRTGRVRRPRSPLKSSSPSTRIT